MSAEALAKKLVRYYQRSKSPEQRAYVRTRSRKRRAAPEYREYMHEYRQTPKYLEYAREYMRNYTANRRALRKTGGASPSLRLVRVVLLLRDGNNCQICYEPLDVAVHIDHAMPLSKFAYAHAYWNLRLTHASCNRSKSDHVTAEAVEWVLRDRPYAVSAEAFGI